MNMSFQKLFTFKQLPMAAKIISHELIDPGQLFESKFVEYTIKITTYYKSWILKKRYSNFEELHKALAFKIPNLPLFPPKRLFKNSPKTIQERKEMFEIYLNFLFKNVNIWTNEEILDFVEMEKDLLKLFVKNHTFLESSSSTALNRYCSMKKSESLGKNARSVEYSYDEGKKDENYYSSFLQFNFLSQDTKKSANTKVIEEFLRNLEQKNENKIGIVKTFEQFLKCKKNWPSFKKEEIKLLLIGETTQVSFNSGNSFNSDVSDDSASSNSKSLLKGLMYHVGQIQQNQLGAEACLDFLSKLIDYEFNPECEAYIYVIKTSKLEFITSMNLNEHFKSNKVQIITIAFRVLKAIMNDDRAYDLKLKKVIEDEKIFQKFTNWYETNHK